MSTETTAAPKIFVCHSERDTPLVSALVDLLETALLLRRGDVFCTSLPGRCLPMGARLDEEIEKKVKDSRVFLYVVTNASLRSEWTRDEFNTRLTLPAETRAILPVRLPNVPVSSFPARLQGLRVAVLDSPAALHELLSEIAAKLGPRERQTPEIYQSKIDAVLQTTKEYPSSPPPASQKRLMQLFVVGSGVGRTFFILPIGPNSDSGEFEKFMKLLVDLKLSDSLAYRELAKVDYSTASATTISSSADALGSIHTLIETTGSDEEFAWFKMGNFVQDYAIRWVRAATSPDSADDMLRDADAILSAIETLVEQLNPPSGLSTEISTFLTLARNKADADTLLKKANDVVNCAYFLL